MPRRTHKKSRNGCLECKRRHIKCDEKRPTCTNCTTSERSCEYADIFRHAARSRTSTPSASSSTVSVAKDQTSDLSTPSSDSLPEDAPANMLHIQLLHHFMTEMRNTFNENIITGIFSPEVMRICMTSSYLMNEVLAFSALHMSICCPAEEAFYHHHAAQLQTHALTILNNMELEINQETCIPLFLFSGILNVHMLCNTLVFRDPDFTQFLDQLVTGFRLHHGVRAVTGTSWAMIRESALRPLILDGEMRFSKNTKPDPECTRLLDLIEKANLGPSITDNYQKAIEMLQFSMNARSHEKQKDIVSEITAWPVLVPPEYIHLLMLRRPEALVVLAYYAVCLHLRRDVWVFGDGGRYLIESINKYLGPDWAEWMDWPMRALNDSHQSK
ncbi:hypothetical protein BBP40_007819 [Aspergillus hancockii]|nr:hypothetical protein BBP40_007819 [Aspergillus hancockii]